MLDIEGRVIGLNAGASNQAASSFWGTRSGRTISAQTNTATRARLTIAQAVRASSSMLPVLGRAGDTLR